MTCATATFRVPMGLHFIARRVPPCSSKAPTQSKAQLSSAKGVGSYVFVSLSGDNLGIESEVLLR
jgi:hypothetical protein